MAQSWAGFFSSWDDDILLATKERKEGSQKKGRKVEKSGQMTPYRKLGLSFFAFCLFAHSSREMKRNKKELSRTQQNNNSGKETKHKHFDLKRQKRESNIREERRDICSLEYLTLALGPRGHWKHW